MNALAVSVPAPIGAPGGAAIAGAAFGRAVFVIQLVVRPVRTGAGTIVRLSPGVAHVRVAVTLARRAVHPTIAFGLRVAMTALAIAIGMRAPLALVTITL